MSTVATIGDIPFGRVKSSLLLPDRNWFTPQGAINISPVNAYKIGLNGATPDPQKIAELTNGRQMCLERVELENGLRYALIRDAQTGEESFDYVEFLGIRRDSTLVGQAEIIPGTDLGNSYFVKMMIASKGLPGHNDKPRSTTYVEKKIEVPGADSHNLHYSIDPLRQSFTGTYDYRLDPESSTVKMDWLSGTPNFQNKLQFSVLTGDNSDTHAHSQVNFIFDNSGKLTEVHLLNDNFNLERTGKEVSKLRKLTNPGEEWLTLKDENLDLPEVRELVKKLLGVEYGQDLVINTKDSLDALLRNLDSETPENPRIVLSFAA